MTERNLRNSSEKPTFWQVGAGVHGRIGAKLGDVRYVYTWDGERVFKVVSFFLAHARGGRIGSLPPGMEIEVAEARWLELEHAPQAARIRGRT